MPTYLLIGIPIVVGILLYVILSLPDEDLPETKTKNPVKKKRKNK